MKRLIALIVVFSLMLAVSAHAMPEASMSKHVDWPNNMTEARDIIYRDGPLVAFYVHIQDSWIIFYSKYSENSWKVSSICLPKVSKANRAEVKRWYPEYVQAYEGVRTSIGETKKIIKKYLKKLWALRASAMDGKYERKSEDLFYRTLTIAGKLKAKSAELIGMIIYNNQLVAHMETFLDKFVEPE